LQATISLRDYLDNGLGGVAFSMMGQIGWYDAYGQPQVVTKNATGYTDGAGNLYLYVEFILGEEYDYPVQYMWISVWLTNGDPPNYSGLEKVGMYGYGDLLYPSVLVVPLSAEQNGNRVPDPWESVMANTFSPVLHKHSWDRQPGLADFEATVYNHSTLKGQTREPPIQWVYTATVPPIHAWRDWSWDSFGSGQTGVNWKISIDDNMRYSSAPVGSRPLYFHVYKPNSEDSYYFLQYWYFFPMNDVTEQTTNHTWHEGNWEHVSIKLQRTTGSSFTAVAVNFYLHDGGKTRTPGQTWWSATNSPTYAGIQQGYDANHTHLHVWLAANSHASYNRYELVYDLNVFSGWIDHYTDNVDYDPTGFDLYFPYDVLVKLGEVTGCAYCPAHGVTWFDHMSANTGTPEWLPYVGLIGDFYTPDPYVIPSTKTPSTTSPARQENWRTFEENYSTPGFGNPSGTFYSRQWIQDPSGGD
jgi:hypothetical protein